MNNSKSVLLIEDDEYDQEIFTYILKSIDDVVIYDIAGDGKEALAKLQNAEKLPDIIFTDIHMPRMNGIECLTAIRKKPELEKIPVIVLSTDNTKIEQVKKLGATAFIKKVGDIAKLREMITRIIHLDFDRDIDVANATFKTGQ